jgi:hypothetical protein
MTAVSTDVRVFIRANAPVFGPYLLYDVPHTVSFTYGSGTVVYTSFHQEPGINQQMEQVLKLLMFEL